MDDDDKKSEDEAAEPAPDAAQDEGAELREVSEEELKQILAAHGIWLETGGEKGERADLSFADLQGAYLLEANLRKANLTLADLQGAILIDANLQEAILIDANLQGAYLLYARLQGADLSFADLQGADLENARLQEASLRNTTFERLIATEGEEPTKDLEAADLTGADLRNADLSDAKLSDVTGLLADKLAGANLSNAKLPEDIAKFEALDHVAEISKHARNNFLAVLGACVFSWLTIATTTDAALLANSAETALPIIGTEIPIAGFYWAAPFILLSLYVYLHIYLQKLWEGLGKLPAIFQDGAAINDKAYPWLLTCLTYLYVPRLRDRRPALWWLQVSLSVVAAWMLVPVTLWLFWWRYAPRYDWLPTHGPAWTFVQFFVVMLSIWAGVLYYQIARKAFVGHGAIYFTWRTNGPMMVCVVLLAALAYYFTFFVDHQSGADFENGNYSGADFVKGNFARANFRAANLQKANLQSANLQGADLEGANLQKADLRRAKLQGAKLYDANLQGADLSFADLQGADLTKATGLTREQLDEVCGDDKTKLPDDLADYQMKACPTPEQPPSN